VVRRKDTVPLFGFRVSSIAARGSKQMTAALRLPLAGLHRRSGSMQEVRRRRLGVTGDGLLRSRLTGCSHRSCCGKGSMNQIDRDLMKRPITSP